MNKILIAIDDGHGMETAGKRTPAFSDGRVMKENEFNSAVADYLAAALERNGFDVLMVAPGDKDAALKTRVQRANDTRAAAYISIHANAYGTAWNDANGLETWIYEKIMPDSQTYRFAKSIHDELVKATGLKNRGMKRSSDLFVLKNTAMHAALVECGFMTNKEEAMLLTDEDYRRKCGEAICRGICIFYDKKYKEEVEKMAEKRYQTIEEAPDWAQPLLTAMDERDCIGDPEHLDMSKDMLRCMVLMDRFWTCCEQDRAKL